MTVTLSSPKTMPPPTGYSQIAEVTKGKIVLIAGQVAHDTAEIWSARTISPPRSSRCSRTSMPPSVPPAAPSTTS